MQKKLGSYMLRFALPVLALLVSTAHAAVSDRMVAIVNDQVITQTQLEQRCALVERELGSQASGLNAAQKKSLCRRSLATLIDQELQRQYATRAGIIVQPTDLMMAKQNGEKAGIFGPGGWNAYSKGLETAAKDKLTAELRWQMLVEKVVRPGISLSNAEVDKMIADMARKRHVTEREISQIMVGVDESDSGEAQAAAQEKIEKIRKKLDEKENFADLARAFSDDKSGINGGRMGWFSSGELNPQLEEALDKMEAGTYSSPIRTPLGWHIIRLDNVRSTTPIDVQPVAERQFFLVAAAKPSDTEALKALEKSLKNDVKGLKSSIDVAGFVAEADTLKKYPASAALGWLPASDLQSGLQPTGQSLKDEQFSSPVEFAGNVGVLYVAGTRTVMPKQLDAYRERVRQHLGESRTELGARRMMRNLRQRAFVDMRY